MSTLSGIGSKGEKQKSKYQSLDINKIYKSTRSDHSEKTQQKSTVPFKHGMQLLGKVQPRRGPVNLPSLKSEHSGSEAAVLLVPPGGSGWVKQESNSTQNGFPAGKTESQNGTPPSHQSVQPPQAPPKQEIPHVPSAPIDKSSWSAMISRGDPHSHHPPPYQGPQFHHDFPSLSSTESQSRGPNIGGTGGPELPYSLGLSLRPQTEGSWIGGGSGPGGEGKQTSGHLGAPPQLSAQAGLAQQQQQTLPPQYRGVMPSFMYKNSPPPPNMSSQPSPLISSTEHSNRHEKPSYSKKPYDDVVQPSIIKEEELHRMDEIERDMGWAYSDDIDYNKKLSFSDDEMLGEKPSKSKHTYDRHDRNSEKRENNDAWQNNKEYSSEEEEIKIKRNQHVKEKEMAVQRAKERKKEEEKRFNEATKQGAHRKLKELEEKMSKRDRDYDCVGTINSSSVLSKPIVPTEILLPDFQKDKHERSKDIHEDVTEKPMNTFKQLTEIEGKTTFRKNSKNQDSREQGVPTFSRQFQSNLPPRFKRQHNQNAQLQPDFENRSLPMTQNYMKNARKPMFGSSDHENTKKDDSSSIISTDNSRKSESPYDFDKHKKDDKNRELLTDKQQDHEYEKISKNMTEIKMKNNRSQDRDSIYERFQRMDSQESKMSRDSKYLSDNDNREYNSWSESKLDMSFEDRRRDGNREDRRQVPGPITRDRIEADDINESRNLTALKKGQMPEKKINEQKNKEEKNNDNMDMQHSDDAETDKLKSVSKRDDRDNKTNEKKKHDDYRDDKRLSNRSKAYPQNKVWNNDYHSRQPDRGGWPKRSNSNKNIRSNVGHKSDTMGWTDSEGSSEDHHHSKDDYSQKRPIKGHVKDDKKTVRSDRERNDKLQDTKRDNYVPRGEPSRHGRGGGNFRGRVGLSKRIDGYGPPPSKSPFTHHDDKKDFEGNYQNSEIGNKNDEKNEGRHLDDKDAKSKSYKNMQNLKPQNNSSKKPNQVSRSASDKKPFGSRTEIAGSIQSKQNKLSDEMNVLRNTIADISLKNKEELVDDDDEIISTDADGFQEVKSKKTVKDRPKVDEKVTSAFPGKIAKPDSKERDKVKKITPPIQQPHNIPPLMATLVNPPQILPQANKNQFDRNRQNKIPPRFAKLRENSRMQKTHTPHGMVDLNEMKNNPGRNMFNPKISSPTAIGGNSVVPNAWEKPLAQLRTMDSDGILGSGLDNGTNVEHAIQGDGEGEKKLNKTAPMSDASILDGATPPVTTIIFENTNFKSVRNDKMRKEETILDNQSMSMKPINDLLNKNDKQADSIQLQLPFKEDSGDMKLDFFDSDLTLSEEKSLKNPCLTTRSMHSMTSSGGNNVSTADALNFKIQSAKKLWETPSEHSVPQEDANNSFSSSFVADPAALDSNSFGKGTGDNVEDNHDQHGYQAANQQTSNSTTNVCKVKPTQQVSGASSQTISNTSGAHPAHSAMMGPGLMGNPLSPPPIQPVIGAGVGIGQPPQQYQTNQHIGYQTSLGSSSQYGMSTIPSPPTVLPYTAQPLQAQTANLYGPFQIDQTGVLGGQGRSQYSQYPNHYGLGQAASSPYSAQSMFLQTQAHPPPAAQAPELYQNLNNYRLSSGPFGQNQQMNNPTTVLISSTSNSLMSASVKPSSQQISAIGTKSGGVGQAYQQQSQQGQQMYMFDPSMQANYLQGAGVLQRPNGPVQNNVVPTIQPSSSYYSGSTGTAKPCNYTWRF